MKIDLSNSEWKLMNRLWQNAPMTITELTAVFQNVLSQRLCQRLTLLCIFLK